MALFAQYSQSFTMYISKTSGYAVHALGCIENGHGQPCFVRDVAQKTGLKKPYLAKIINQLVHHGFLVGKRGYRGGVSLARPAEQISLLQIVEAMEGAGWRHACLFGLQECPSQTLCPAHRVWQDMQSTLERLLRTTTLAQVIRATQPQKSVPRAARRLLPIMPEAMPIPLVSQFPGAATVAEVRNLCRAHGK